jgi:hypothetical protein
MEITDYKHLDLSKISYTKPCQTKQVYYGGIQYNDLSFKLKSSNLIIKEINKQDIVFQVEHNDFSFYDTLIKLDDHNLSSTYKHSKDWFEKELPMNVLETMYKRISVPFKKDSIPTIKIPYKGCQVYDEHSKKIDIKDLSNGKNVRIILDINGLKFLRKNYLCEIQISQIKLCNEHKKDIGCLIEDDEPEDLSQYDYEIIDEEIVHNNKEKIKLQQDISELTQKIQKDQNEIKNLQQKLNSL